MASSKRTFQMFCDWFVQTLFCDQTVDRSEFESRSHQRYKMSKLNPSIFDDALIFDRFKRMLLRDISVERIHREDLSETELMQNIQHLCSSPFMRSKQSYLQCVDAKLLAYYVDTPTSSRHRASKASVFLSSKIGFRKWTSLPAELRHIRTNTFYEPNNSDPSFLHSNALTVYTTQSAQWFMGVSAFAAESKNRHLWLRNCSNDAVVSIAQAADATNLRVHFPDGARLAFCSKPKATVLAAPKTDEEEPNGDDADKAAAEEKEETLATTQKEQEKEDIIYLSASNEMTVEYHRATGQLVMYYATAVEKYHAMHAESEYAPQAVEQPDDEAADTEKEKAKPEKTPEKADDADDADAKDDELPSEPEALNVAWKDADDVFVVWRH